MLYALFTGKLLLEIHICLRTCKYDFGICGNTNVRFIPNARISQLERVYGADDYVQVNA